MIMRMTLISLFLLFTGTMKAQEEYVPYLQRDLLLKISACATEKCVDEVVSTAPYVDPPLKLIAASQVHRIMKADAAAARLLDALPGDPVAFWFCYAVTAPSLGSKFAEVRRLYDTYFPAAAAAAADTGNVIAFMRLAAFADGEMAAVIAEDIEGIRKLNPSSYCKALEELHTTVQRHLLPCGRASAQKH